VGGKAAWASPGAQEPAPPRPGSDIAGRLPGVLRLVQTHGLVYRCAEGSILLLVAGSHFRRSLQPSCGSVTETTVGGVKNLVTAFLLCLTCQDGARFIYSRRYTCVTSCSPLSRSPPTGAEVLRRHYPMHSSRPVTRSEPGHGGSGPIFSAGAASRSARLFHCGSCDTEGKSSRLACLVLLQRCDKCRNGFAGGRAKCGRQQRLFRVGFGMPVGGMYFAPAKIRCVTGPSASLGSWRNDRGPNPHVRTPSF
jgi:hypothetical protein